MKKTMLLVFSIFLLILNYSFLYCSAVVHDPVRDADGAELREGVEYFILSLGQLEGGLTLEKPVNYNDTTEISCNFTVGQHFLDPGLPISFRPAFNISHEPLIWPSTDLSIIFNRPIIFCNYDFQILWNLEFVDEIGRYVVGITSEEAGNPGCDTLTRWFQIEAYNLIGGQYDYKFVFCPKVCNSYFCKPICKDVGIFDGAPDGIPRLSLIDEGTPFIFQFKKAA